MLSTGGQTWQQIDGQPQTSWPKATPGITELWQILFGQNERSDSKNARSGGRARGRAGSGDKKRGKPGTKRKTRKIASKGDNSAIGTEKKSGGIRSGQVLLADKQLWNIKINTIGTVFLSGIIYTLHRVCCVVVDVADV